MEEWRLSDRIDSLRSDLEWAEKNTKIIVWCEHEYSNTLCVNDLIRKLKLSEGICYWAERHDGWDDYEVVNETDMDELEFYLYEKQMEINPILLQVENEGLKFLDSEKYQFLFSNFLDAAKSLESLFLKTVDKFNNELYLSSSSCQRSKSQCCDSSSEGLDLQDQEKLLNFMIPLLVSVSSPVEMGREMEVVLNKLEFLKELIRFADYRCVPKYDLRDLFAHGLFIVMTTVYYSYMHQRPQVLVDEAASKVIDNQFSHIRIMEPPTKVREIYVEVLEATLWSTCQETRTRTAFADDNHETVVWFTDSLVKNHMQLLESKSTFMVSAIEILAEQMRFLKNFLVYKRYDSNMAGDVELARRTIDLIIEAGILIYSHSWDDNLKTEVFFTIRDADTELRFSTWMKNVEEFKRDVLMKYPETSLFKFPRTHELGFIDGLLEDLKQSKIREDNKGLTMDHHQILEDLIFLRDFLGKIATLRHEDRVMNALWIQVVDVAYRIEFLTNSMEVGDSSLDCTPDSFSTIKEEIQKIKARVEEIYAEEEKKGILEEINDVLKKQKVSNKMPLRSSSNYKMDEMMIGFEDAIKEMIDRIESISSKLDIVSIVGMGGQGKTTLAKKVYNEVESHFHVRSWCCISQGYQKHKWLVDILSGITGRVFGYNSRTEEDLEQEICQSLKGKRYLIVLDDIWDIQAWKHLKICFPDDGNGSKILLTTRIQDLALQAARSLSEAESESESSLESDHNMYFLRPLNDDERWKLLRNRLFQNVDCCPDEDLFKRVGKKIVKSCGGLPFVIITVAGILGTMETDQWEEFVEGFNELLENHTDVLELSYIHLPDYLKPCLLYFGSFLQDQSIPVSRIIWLWIAEGLIQKEKTVDGKQEEEESLEILAMEYLKDLIKRSLVMVENENSRGGGGIKSCSIHDLVHQFCTTKAQEENFQQHLILPKQNVVALPEPYRLCIYSSRRYFSQVRFSFRHLSSLILFPIGIRSHELYEISSTFKHFKLLKVLDLRGFICSCFPPEIEKLLQLRYLAIVGEITSVPARTTAKLSKLKTFILRGTRGEITLPYNLLIKRELRHLKVNNRVVFDLPEEEEKGDSCQESCNFESFCTLRLSSYSTSGQETGHNIIKKIKNIKKLKCTFFGSWDSEAEEGYQITAELNNLKKLESLKLHSTGRVTYQLELNNVFPSNLIKLTLSNFYLPWERISVLAKLENLRVLKLLNKACEGETWDMGEEEVFSNLQFLKLENLDVVHWNAYSENFPRLRQLDLNSCKNLEEIPMEMEGIDTLSVVEVKWCQESVATSAEALRESIEGLKIFIQIRKS